MCVPVITYTYIVNLYMLFVCNRQVTPLQKTELAGGGGAPPPNNVVKKSRAHLPNPIFGPGGVSALRGFWGTARRRVDT